MAKHDPSTAVSLTYAGAPLEAAFDACGDSPEALRECVLALRHSARAALDVQLNQTLESMEYDARSLCARELSAQLSDVNVCELLQTIMLGRKNAVIDVFQGSLLGRIWCSNGEIVDAVSGRLLGEPAVYRVLSNERGELVADFRPVHRTRTVQAPTQTLLLDAARRKDECALLEKRLGGAQRVYFAVGSAKTMADASRIEAALIAAFDGGARIEAVRANSAVDDLTLLQAIWALVERGRLSANPAGPSQPTPHRGALGRAQTVPSAPHGPRALLPRAILPPLGTLHLAAVHVTARLALAALWLRRHVGPRALAASVACALMIAWLLLPADPAPEMPLSTARAALEPDPDADADALDGTYPVQAVVEPAQAALWLDGNRIGTGELSIVLPRDGRTHELRIVAQRHHPQTFLFRDVPPPRAIRLEPANEEDVEPREGLLAPAEHSPSIAAIAGRPPSAPEAHARVGAAPARRTLR